MPYRDRPRLKSLSVIIPAYNEEDGVAPQVADIGQVLTENEIPHEIIVVDDGSEDRTAERARQAGARVIHHPINLGYGAALKTGVAAAENETVAFIDADGTYPADAIPQLLEKCEEYDMVVGARAPGSSNIPAERKAAKWLLTKLASYLAEQRIPDLNSGLRIMRKSLVERFAGVLPSGFSFTTSITLALLCNDYLVCYVPVEYRARIGHSKIKALDAYHFLLLILRTVVYFNPLKVFLPMGAILFAGGFIKFVYDAFLWNLSESAVLAILGAFVIWAIGLLADQISKVLPSARPK